MSPYNWKENDDLKVIKAKIGHNHELKKRLGEGGYSKVYLVHHTTFNVQRALKIMDTDFVLQRIRKQTSTEIKHKKKYEEIYKRFFTEAKNYEKIDHPNIVKIYDVGTVPDIKRDIHIPYLIMSYIEGENLAKKLRDKSPLDIPEVLKISEGILGALNAMHKRNVIHRDIKPGNIMIEKDSGKAILIDFGLAKDKLNDPKLTTSSKPLGTPMYMSPEQLKEPKNVEYLTDIYSFGVVLYEMLTGVVPFGGNPGAIMDHPIPDPKEKNPNLPDGIKKVIYKAMAKEPRNRYQKANYFLKALKRQIKKQEKEEDIQIGKSTPTFDHESLVGQKILNRYEVQKIIDSGGKGIVYKVKDKTGEEIKAIKLFPPRYKFDAVTIKKINDDLKLASKISHGNVMKVFLLEEDKERGLIFIVMEYIDGITLKKKLETSPDNKLKEEEALDIMKQIASALIKAHNKGVINGDLGINNIMITKDNFVKVCNFGQSRQLKISIREMEGESLAWFNKPPEMLTGAHLEEIQENEQVDVWGFGVTMYQILTGKIPFKKEQDIRKPGTVLPKIEGVSDNTNDVMMKCLKTDISERYKNLREVFHVLFGDDQSTQPFAQQEELLPSGPFFNPLKFFSNWKILLGVLLLGAVIGLISMGVFSSTKTRLYKMWYSGNPGHPDIPGGCIGYAKSYDGIKWIRYPKNPIILRDQFNQFESAFPYVVYNGKRFHMLFCGGKNNEGISAYKIGYATSLDGIRWKLDGPQPVILDNGNIKYPGPIIYLEGYYKMWFTNNGDIYYSYTRNLKHSIKELVRYGDKPVVIKGNPNEWDNKGVIVGSVLYEDNLYKMWYTGISGESNKIGYATSTDGINWQKYPGNPVYDDETITLEMNPTVIHDSEGYKMYYSAATEGNNYYPVRLATSTDGIIWTKYSNVPVLPGGKDNWEKMRLFVTVVRVEEHEQKNSDNTR